MKNRPDLLDNLLKHGVLRECEDCCGVGSVQPGDRARCASCDGTSVVPAKAVADSEFAEIGERKSAWFWDAWEAHARAAVEGTAWKVRGKSGLYVGFFSDNSHRDICIGTPTIPEALALIQRELGITTSSPSAEAPVPAEQATGSSPEAPAEGGVICSGKLGCGAPISEGRGLRKADGTGFLCHYCVHRLSGAENDAHEEPGHWRERVADPEPETSTHPVGWPSQFCGPSFED